MALSYSGSPEQNAARVLRAQWERYKNVYTPVEDALIGSLNEDMTGPAMEMARESNERSAQVTERMRERYGMSQIAPDQSERSAQLSDALAVDSAYNRASMEQIDRRDNIRASLVNVGQGILNQATGGLSSASSMQSRREQANANAEAQYDAQRSQRNTAIASTAIMAAAMFI